MTGKVFDNSRDIYQDQARILFDYYKAAAEKIVSEEMAVEQNIADLEDARKEAEKHLKKRHIAAFVAGGVCLVLGIFLPLLFVGTIAAVIIGYKWYKEYKDALETIEKNKKMTEEMVEKYNHIRRDYKVDKIGVAYVPVATRVPFEDKSFLIDHMNTVPEIKFDLTMLHQPEKFQEAVKSLQDSMETIPVVEPNEMPEMVDTSEYSLSIQNVTLHDYMGNVDRQVRNVGYLLGDSETISVEMPVIGPDSTQAEYIREYATKDVGDKPVISAFSGSFDEKLAAFTSLNALKKEAGAASGADSTEHMRELMTKLAQSVQLLSKSKNSSAANLMDYTSSIFANVLKSAYTQYSPVLEAEEIERIRTTDFDYQTAVNHYEPFHLKPSSRVKFDMFSGNWVAEDGSRTSMPFGMHQIDEEILMPVITALMEENRIERLKVYNNIEDQKREYLEKWSSEVGNYFRDNRKSADELVTRMRETYADYVSAYNMYQSLQNTSKAMKTTKDLDDAEVKELDAQAEIIAGFEAQAKSCNEQQEQFSQFMDRIQEDISENTRNFAYIKYYEGALRDSVSHDTAIALSNVHMLDERRRQLLYVSPYLASYAKLPPSPQTNPEMLQDVRIDLEQQVAENISRIDELKEGKATA